MRDEREFLDENDMGVWAQLAFLEVAATGVTIAALKLFRYQSDENYYDNGDLIDRNWWKLAS